jgi:hypothetical protein
MSDVSVKLGRPKERNSCSSFSNSFLDFISSGKSESQATAQNVSKAMSLFLFRDYFPRRHRYRPVGVKKCIKVDPEKIVGASRHPYQGSTQRFRAT